MGPTKKGCHWVKKSLDHSASALSGPTASGSRLSRVLKGGGFKGGI